MKTKKLFSIGILCTILCLTCTGCTPGEDLLTYIKSEITGTTYLSTEARTYNEAVDNFFAALDSGDETAVREQFSVYVQEESPGFDEQIDKLMALYSGPTDGCGRDGRYIHGDYTSRYGGHASIIDSTFPVLSNGTYYWCYFKFTYEYTTDEDHIGITKVVFYSADDYYSTFYDDENTFPEEEAGLFVFNEESLDIDICAIHGNPYEYPAVTTILNEEEAKAFLEKTNSYTDFVAEFGEPIASWVYYYYELPPEDGQSRYLLLSVDEDRDAITHASGVDAFQWLYNIWDEDEDYDE